MMWIRWINKFGSYWLSDVSAAPACLYDSSSNINSSGFSMLSFTIMDRYIGPWDDAPSTSSTSSFLFESCRTLALSFITCFTVMPKMWFEAMLCEGVLSCSVVCSDISDFFHYMPATQVAWFTDYLHRGIKSVWDSKNEQINSSDRSIEVTFIIFKKPLLRPGVRVLPMPAYLDISQC